MNSFKNELALNTHIIRVHPAHTNKESPHQCEICKKIFLFKSHLQAHIIWHSNEANFKCDVCGKAFKAKRNRAVHYQTVHGEKKEKNVACTVCGKKFLNNYHLSKHSYVHSERRQFLCENCGFAFKRRNLLVRHLRDTCKKIERAIEIKVEIKEEIIDD